MNDEILVHYTDLGKQIMVFDSGSPVSLTGKEWMEKYLKEFGLEIGEMRNTVCPLFVNSPQKTTVQHVF